MLVLLIPGMESVKNNNVDVYLAPLVRSYNNYGKEWTHGRFVKLVGKIIYLMNYIDLGNI